MKFQQLFMPFFCLFMASSWLFAQTGQHRNCGTMEHLAHLKAENPSIETNMKQIEKETQKWIAAHGNEKTRLLVTIPVVVHVVYNTTTQNISTAQIQSQITVLNEDFRRLNADKANTPSAFTGVAADAQIEFCLATTDPNGATTTGITRTQTSFSSFSDNDDVKFTANGGHDAWNTSKYLNLWVCNLSGGLLGYAQFPGGAANTDGVVILFSAFGNTGTLQAPYNKGRTATHEIGHWLNLQHIWGDATCGNDNVADTPTQEQDNGGCPTFPHVTCNNGTNGDMFMNYMDYTDDACMNLFTVGQSTRMTAAINTSRSGLLTSQGCMSTGNTVDVGVSEISYPSGTVCSTSFSMVAVLKNYGTSTVTAANIDYNVSGGSAGTYTWTGSLAAGASTFVVIPGLMASIGSHSMSATAVASNDANAANNGVADNLLVNVGGGSTSLTETFQSLNFPVSGWGLVNYDGSTTWVRTTNAGAGGSSSCMYMNNFDYTGGQNAATGQSDMVLTPLIHVPTSNGKIEFDVAYAYYIDATGSLSDSLKIGISTDCGQSFALLYNKGGADLATTAPLGSAFVPTSSQWRHETIDLSNYADEDVVIRFRNLCNYANNLYIDNINLTGLGVGVEPALQNGVSFSLYPNPTDEMVSIDYKANGNTPLNVQVLDLTGRIIAEKSYNLKEGSHQLELNVANLASGYYFVKLIENEKVGVQKLRVK